MARWLSWRSSCCPCHQNSSHNGLKMTTTGQLAVDYERKLLSSSPFKRIVLMAIKCIERRSGSGSGYEKVSWLLAAAKTSSSMHCVA